MNFRIPVAPHMCPTWRSNEKVKSDSSGHWHIYCTDPRATVGITMTNHNNKGDDTRPGPDVHVRYRAQFVWRMFL